jgi:signal transduction histidine kinase
MESLALATVVVDNGGIISAVDGAACGVILEKDLVGRTWAEVFSGWGLPSALPEDPKAYPFLLRGRTPKGDPVFVEVFRLPHAGAGRATVAVFRSDEITALPYRLQQLCAVGEVACGVSHEMNNALTLVCGWLEVLRGELGENSPHLRILNVVREEAARTAELTRNLQEVARGASETPRDLNLNELLGDVTGLVRREMEKNRIVVDSQIAPDLPTVCGSAGRLKQALLNLLVNARQAMPDGGRIVLTADRERDGRVAVSVQDTGCGIPLELHSHVFHTFFTTKADGTGLGLPITKKIVEDHGGVIQMESEPGHGARFTIRLPARAEP